MFRGQQVAISAEPECVFLARGLSKVYRTGDVEVEALRSLDLELHRGELLVLLGASGSGKSTLLNILGGLDTATSGTVLFGDHDLTRMSARELTSYRREHVGFVFQFYNLIPGLTAHSGAASAFFYVRDADDLYAELLGSGADLRHEPVNRPWGIREFAVLDPEGNRLTFGQTFE